MYAFHLIHMLVTQEQIISMYACLCIQSNVVLFFACVMLFVCLRQTVQQLDPLCGSRVGVVRSEKALFVCVDFCMVCTERGLF